MPENNHAENTGFKRIVTLIWCMFILVCLILYLVYAQDLSPENISGFLKNYEEGMMVLYLVLCTIRGLTMIPGTPFLLAGIILFKDSPFLLLAAFLASMLFTSALMFYMADKLGFARYFEDRYPEKIAAVRNKLNGKYGFLFILLWAFAPVTPTDLVCYVAGSIRMKFIKLIIPLLIGEAIICAFYIFNGKALVEYVVG